MHGGRALAGNNGEVIARLAENGDGIALLPQFIVADAISKGSLVRILEDWRPPDLWLTLYYPPYDKLPMRVSTFSDLFETYVTTTRPI